VCYQGTYFPFNEMKGTGPLAMSYYLQDEEQFLCHVVQLCLGKKLTATDTFKVCDFDGEYCALTPRLRDILQSEFSMKVC